MDEWMGQWIGGCMWRFPTRPSAVGWMWVTHLMPHARMQEFHCTHLTINFLHARARGPIPLMIIMGVTIPLHHRAAKSFQSANAADRYWSFELQSVLLFRGRTFPANTSDHFISLRFCFFFISFHFLTEEIIHLMERKLLNHFLLSRFCLDKYRPEYHCDTGISNCLTRTFPLYL